MAYLGGATREQATSSKGDGSHAQHQGPIARYAVLKGPVTQFKASNWLDGCGSSGLAGARPARAGTTLLARERGSGQSEPIEK